MEHKYALWPKYRDFFMLKQVVHAVPTVLSSVKKNLVCVDWILMVQVRVQRYVLVNPVIELRVPKRMENFSARWASINFCKKTLLHRISSDIVDTTKVH
jgi:hypothetical protein